MSGKAAANRRVLAIQAKKKRKNPKRKGKGVIILLPSKIIMHQLLLSKRLPSFAH